jgi:predicted DNA-binding ArsR family transcriptional regulator
MANELGYSVETLRKYINELVESGWIVKGEQERKKGTFGATSYTLRANKKSCTENTDTENFRHGKTPIQHNIYIEQKRDNKNKKDKTFNVRADLSYVEDIFFNIWNEWLDYKDEIKKQYKTQRGAKTQYNSLVKYANNNPILANAIVKQSIERSWDGLFALTDKQVDLFLSRKSPYSIDNNSEQLIAQQSQSETLIINGQIYK